MKWLLTLCDESEITVFLNEDVKKHEHVLRK